MSNALAKQEAETESMRELVHGIKRRAKEQTQGYVRTAVVSTTGFALGAAEAKWGSDAAFGMSPSLAAGLVAHGLALAGVGGKAATPHLMAVGDAGLCVYGFQQGNDMMTRYMEDDGETPTTTTGG